MAQRERERDKQRVAVVDSFYQGLSVSVDSMPQLCRLPTYDD